MNPYQYGYNNPLVYVDPSGKVAVAIPLIIFGGGVVSAGASALSQYMKYGNWNCVDWNEVAIAGVVGMVGTGLGMFAAIGIAGTGLGLVGSLGLSVLFDTAIGEGLYALDRGLHGEKYEFSVRRAATNAVISVVTFGVGYGAVKALSAIKPKIVTSAAAEAVTEVVEESASSIKAGSITGPKPFGTGPHNEKITEVAAQVKDGRIIAGGQILPETTIPTPAGIKSSRRPDIIVEKPDGSIYGINVGRTTNSGALIKREIEAIYDLEDAGIPMYFVPYFK